MELAHVLSRVMMAQQPRETAGCSLQQLVAMLAESSTSHGLQRADLQ